MKKLNVYDVYMDDNYSTFKVTIPAHTVKEAKAVVAGNGEVVATKLSSLQDIDLDCLTDTLRTNGWGQQEIDVITRTLDLCGLRRG